MKKTFLFLRAALKTVLFFNLVNLTIKYVADNLIIITFSKGKPPDSLNGFDREDS